ncbi:unnamed protein product, partial [Prunus brigantina]
IFRLLVQVIWKASSLSNAYSKNSSSQFHQGTDSFLCFVFSFQLEFKKTNSLPLPTGLTHIC